MPTWMIDTVDGAAQRVLDSYVPPDSADPRFRKITAETLQAATARATFERVALLKMQRVMAGHHDCMSDQELDWLIDHDHHPTNVVSIPNWQQVGTLDRYIACRSDHSLARAFRDDIDAKYQARLRAQSKTVSATAIRPS